MTTSSRDRETWLRACWSIAGLVLFVMGAFLVERGVTQNVDNAILRRIHELALRADRPGRLWGEESVIAVTSLGAQVNLVCACVAVLGFLVFLRRWQPCLFILLALLGTIGLNHWLKPFFGRARPDVVPHAQYVETQSFPSGHALISTAVYLALGLVGARMLRDGRMKVYTICLACALAFFIGLSRLYLGVHYPTDVLAGWLLGALWVALSDFVARLCIPADAPLRQN